MLRLQNISKYYHSNDVVALGLRKVNLEFKLGEFVAVTGESGSGKSTLLNVISGLDTYEDGEMYVNGEETSYYSVEEWESYRRQYIGFVFQNYNIIDSYSVLENVMVALTIQGYDKLKRKERALELIEKVGLTSHIHHKASKLSGGQKQRAVIARALAKDCPIIVADEPTGNLDSESGDNIMSLLKEVSKDKLVIVVTHNYEQVAQYATRKIRLFDGEVVEDKKIKKRENVDEGVTLASYRMAFTNLLQMALKNLIRTPRRTIFTIVIAMFISLIFVFSYGAYVQALNSNNYIYGGGYYTNMSDRRIIVTKFDDTAFTDDELSTIGDISNVRYVLNDDVILDSMLFAVYESSRGYTNMDNFLVNPADMLSSGDLKSGRLPQNEFEVVVQDPYGDFTVGQTLSMSVNENYDIVYYAEDAPGGVVSGSSTNNDDFTVTIVGITNNIAQANYGYRNVYVHQDLLDNTDIMLNAYMSNNWRGNILQVSMNVNIGTVNPMPMETYFSYQIDNTLSDNQIRMSYQVLDNLSRKIYDTPYEDNPDFWQGFTADIGVTSAFYNADLNNITILGDPVPATDEEKWAYNYTVSMNENMYKALLPQEHYQIAVMVRDQYDANKVMSALNALGYNTIYPSSVSTQFDQFAALGQTISFTILISLLVVIIYFVTYVVLRNVQQAKKKDFLIFRSIGASKKDLNKVTIIELFYIFVFALFIVLTFFVINEFHQIWVIPQYLRFFTVGSYIMLFILLSGLAILLGNRFNKRIFSRSVITSLKQE